jgi:hypothetical protein
MRCANKEFGFWIRDGDLEKKRQRKKQKGKKG